MTTPPKVLAPRLRSAWFGFTIPFKSAKLILRQRELLIWAVIPIVLTLVLYFYVIQGAQAYLVEMVEGYLTGQGLDPEGWAFWSARILTQIGLLIVAALTFTFTSTIVASPFNDWLAEKAELYGNPQLPSVPKTTWKDQIRLVGIDMVKTFAATLAAIAALVFSWIPILNIIAFTAAFLLVTFQYISYPQTRRKIPLRVGLVFLRQHFFACLGFGATITILFAIPFVASLALPMAVVGGTLLTARAPGSANLFRLK